MNTHAQEPLSPDPQWKPVNGPAHFHSDRVPQTIVHPPAAYALGFSDGAYALAKELLQLASLNGTDSIVKTLINYQNGLAHPTKGWEYEKH